MARKLRVFAWFNFLTPSPFLPFHSFPSHRVFLRLITVHRSLTLPNPNSFSPPYSTLVFIPLLSPSLPLPIFSSYSLNPRPGTSLLHWSHSLPPSFTPPTDLPLSSFTFFPFLLLPTPLLIFSVPLPSHPTPLPFPSSLLLLHVFLLLQTYPYLPSLFFVSPTLLLFSILLLSHPTPLLQIFPYLPSLFFLSSSIILLSTALLIFSVRISSHPTPLPFPSLLSLPHVLPPPIDLPLSSFALFPFPLHRSPSYPSPHILRSRPSIPYTPPISLLPFTASCPSSSYRPSPLLSPSLFLSLPCHAPSGHQCLIFHMPSPSALFLPEYNCVTITVKLSRFSIKLLSGFIIEKEEQAKQSLCESLHNKLLSVQSALKVCVWLSIVFFSYQFPSRPNNNNPADRAYTYQRIISVEKRDW